MISIHDLLDLVLILATITITAVVVMVGFHLTRVLGDVERIAQNVEQMTALLERLSHISFPGMERVAKSADRIGTRLADSLDKLTKP